MKTTFVVPTVLAIVLASPLALATTPAPTPAPGPASGASKPAPPPVTRGFTIQLGSGRQISYQSMKTLGADGSVERSRLLNYVSVAISVAEAI